MYHSLLFVFSTSYHILKTYALIDGTELQGQYILEIPASNAKLSNIDYYKSIAAEYGVELRFTPE